jgi:hypothetical protein
MLLQTRPQQKQLWLTDSSITHDPDLCRSLGMNLHKKKGRQ